MRFSRWVRRHHRKHRPVDAAAGLAAAIQAAIDKEHKR